MSRAVAEESNALSIFWLKKQGYFSQGGTIRRETISWSYGGGKSSIGIYAVAGMEEATGEPSYIKLNYTVTDRWTGEKNDMDFKILLATTPCNFGGVRYWFVCPLYKEEDYCGRRVGVIYRVGKYFGCRHCGNIAYQSQFEGGNFRAGSNSELNVEKAYNEVRLQYYDGKPTRKYKRYLRLREKMDNSWFKMMTRLGNNF